MELALDVTAEIERGSVTVNKQTAINSWIVDFLILDIPGRRDLGISRVGVLEPIGIKAWWREQIKI